MNDDWVAKVARHLRRMPDGMDGFILGLAVAAMVVVIVGLARGWI